MSTTHISHTDPTEPRHRVLVVVDPSACGIDAVERVIGENSAANSELRTVVIAAGRTSRHVDRARRLLDEATRIGQRHGFRSSGWNVVRSVGELAHDLELVPTFDHAELVVPARGRLSAHDRLRRVLRRRGVLPLSACAA